MRTVFIIVMILLSGIIFVNIFSIDHLKDEGLMLESRAFFAPDPINLENNFIVALSGLYAPSEDTDLYGFGMKVYQGRIDRRTLKRLRFQNDIGGGKRHCTRQGGYYKYDDHYAYSEVCYTPEELDMLYTQNEQLIFRYGNLLREASTMLVSVGDANNIGVASMQDIISMQNLLLDVWINQAQKGHGDAVLKEWMISTRAFQHIISGKLGVLDYMIWTIVYSMNLNGLPAILDADPTLISKYGVELRDVLGFDYMAHWNVEQMLRVDVSFLMEVEKKYKLQSSVFYAPDAMRNALYGRGQRVIALSQIPPNELYYDNDRDASLLQCSLFKILYCLPHYVIVNEMLVDFPFFRNLFTNAHRSVARQKELIIWIDAHMQNIHSGDMAVFLKKSERNPVNIQPFLWDNDRRFIYYKMQDKHGVLQQRGAIYY